MLPPIPVVLAAYNTEWPQIAAAHADRLRTLGSILVMVYHIGSTAVAGLATKPIIDLIPLVDDLGNLERERWHVEALGHNWHGELGVSGRRYRTLPDAWDFALSDFIFSKRIRVRLYVISRFGTTCAHILKRPLPIKKKNAARETSTPIIPTPTRTRRLCGRKIRRPKQSLGLPEQRDSSGVI